MSNATNSQKRSPRVGGSFAPPLTDDLIQVYQDLIDGLDCPSPVYDAMAKLMACVRQWWDLPESSPDGSQPHPSGSGVIVPLDSPIASALWEAIPWKHELDGMQALFDAIPAGTEKALRDAAFHLLWHVKELDLDREPITSEKL